MNLVINGHVATRPNVVPLSIENLEGDCLTTELLQTRNHYS